MNACFAKPSYELNCRVRYVYRIMSMMLGLTLCRGIGPKYMQI